MNWGFFSILTVVPEAPSVALGRVWRDEPSAVAGRVALFARFGATVVDALAVVDGLEAEKKKNIQIFI